MRTMILALAVVLLAAPAWAGVTITVTKITDTKVAIGYNDTESQLVRAFALDLTVTDGNIVGIADYAVGDDNKGYGIFPGNFSLYITVNGTTGMVDSWDDPNYTPVAPADDPGALGGIGTAGATLEMGSLYDANAPLKTGVLCTVTVSAGTKELHVNGNAIRGNIVMEDASEVVPVEVIYPFITDCFPSTPEYAGQYARWVALKKPECWCAGWKTGNQCYGDAAGDTHSRGYIVYTTDLTKLAAAWKLVVNPDGSLPAGLDPCADFKHDVHSRGYVVYTTDLAVLASKWKLTSLPGNCPLNDVANAAR